MVRCYNVLKTSVSFRYQLWRLCNVLSWSVSLKYQLICRYNVSNWSVWTNYQWDVTKTSQLGRFHSRTSRDVVMTSQHGPRRLDLYKTQIRCRYDVACRVGLSSKFVCVWLLILHAKIQSLKESRVVVIEFLSTELKETNVHKCSKKRRFQNIGGIYALFYICSGLGRKLPYKNLYKAIKEKTWKSLAKKVILVTSQT